MEAAEKITPEIKKIETKALAVPDQARAIEIIDDDTYQKAADFLLTIKDIRKEINSTFDPIIKKNYEAHKESVKQKKRHEAPLLEAEKIIKPRIAEYQVQQERKRREEEARLREEARKQEEDERLAAALEAEKEGCPEEAQAILDTPVNVPPPVVPTAAPKVSGITTKTVWKFRVVNPALVPEQYKIVDEKAIGAVVRAQGARARIPGVQVYSEQQVAAGRR